MDFLDKLQEVIYDIIGYLLPGLIVVFILTPSVITYTESGIINSPINVVCNKDMLAKSNWLINMDFKSTKGIVILVLAWLVGHLIKSLARTFYKGIVKIEKRFLGKDNEKLKNEDDIIKKSAEIYNKKFGANKMNLCNEIEKRKILASFGRTEIRMYNVSSLVQKYIAKYNLYQSLACICFLLYLNVFIIFLSKHLIGVLISSLIALVIYAAILLTSKKLLEKYSKNHNICNRKLNRENRTNNERCSIVNISCLRTFSGLLWFLIIPAVIVTLKDKSMCNYLILYFVLIFLFSIFDYEYRRHYMLQIKEALYGIIYVDDNEETRYAIKYTKN